MKKLKEDGLNNAQNYSSTYRGRNRADRSRWSPERKELCQIAGEIQGRGFRKTLEVEMQFSGGEEAKLHSVCSQRSYINPDFHVFCCIFTLLLSWPRLSMHQWNNISVLFHGAGISLQSLDASVPLVWSPCGPLLVALLLEASLPPCFIFYPSDGKSAFHLSFPWGWKFSSHFRWSAICYFWSLPRPRPTNWFCSSLDCPFLWEMKLGTFPAIPILTSCSRRERSNMELNRGLSHGSICTSVSITLQSMTVFSCD